MFQKTLHMLIGIFLLFSTALCKINIDEFKGTYDIVKEEKKYLSPFNGFIWVESGIIKNYYDFGNAVIKTRKDKKKRDVEVFVSGDSAIRLVRKLFKTEGGNFIQRAQKTHASSLLKAKTIGTILKYIDETEEEIDAHIKQLFDAAKQWEIDLGTFRLAPKNANSVEKVALVKSTELLGKSEEMFVSKYNLPQKNFGELRKIQTTSSEYRKNINSLKISCFCNSKKKLGEKISQAITIELANTKIDKKSTTYNSLEKDIPRLSEIIVNALGETAGFSENPKYVKYFVHNVLLSFLYMTINKKEDLADYFSVFGGSVLDLAFDYVSEEKFDPKDTPSDISINEDKNEQIVMANFEKYCYGEIYKSKFAADFPAFAAHQKMEEPTAPGVFKIEEDAGFGGDGFANCAEITIYNFVRILLTVLDLYDNTSNTFLIGNLEKTLQKQAEKLNLGKPTVNPKLINFFNSINNSALTISGEAFHIALTELVSDIPGVKYLQSFDKNKKELKFKDKFHNCPYIHENKNVEKIEVEKKIDVTATTPDAAYNFELAGCPSSFVKIINYLFGLNFENFGQLCQFFGFMVRKEDIEKFIDETVYLETDVVRIPFAFTFKKNDCIMELMSTAGHSEINFLKKSREAKPYHDKYFWIPSWNDFRYQNLTSCFPQISAEKLTDPGISKLTPAEKLHLFFVVFYNDGCFLDVENIQEVVKFVENQDLCDRIRMDYFLEKIDTHKILKKYLKAQGLKHIIKPSRHLIEKINNQIKYEQDDFNPENPVNLLTEIINKTNSTILFECEIALSFLDVHRGRLLDPDCIRNFKKEHEFLIGSFNMDLNKKLRALFLNLIKKYEDLAQTEALNKKIDKKTVDKQTVNLIKQSVLEIFKPVILISATTHSPSDADYFNESTINELVNISASMINTLKTNKLFLEGINLVKQDDKQFSEWIDNKKIKSNENIDILLLYIIYSAETVALDECLEKLIPIYFGISDENREIWMKKYKTMWLNSFKQIIKELRTNNFGPLIDELVETINKKIESIEKIIDEKEQEKKKRLEEEKLKKESRQKDKLRLEQLRKEILEKKKLEKEKLEKEKEIDNDDFEIIEKKELIQEQIEKEKKDESKRGFWNWFGFGQK